MRLAGLLLLALLAAAPMAWGQDAPRVPLRIGSHPDLGRVVFDWPSEVGYRVEEGEGRVLIRFAAPGRIDLAAARRPPRNVLGVEQQGEAILLRIAPGARVRHFRLGNRIVVDVRDPATEAASAAPAESRAAPRRGAAAPQRAAAASAPGRTPSPQSSPPDTASPRAAAASAAGSPAGPQISLPADAAPLRAPGSTPQSAPPAAAPSPRTTATPAAGAPRPQSTPPTAAALGTSRAAGGTSAAPQHAAAVPDIPPASGNTPGPQSPPSATAPRTAAAPGIPPISAITPGPQPAATPPRTPPAPGSPSPPRSVTAPAPPTTTALPGPSSLRLLHGAPAIALDAGPDAGLSLFRRGEWVHLVLDRPLDTDLAPLRGHPVFGQLERIPAGEATALRLPLAAPARLAARRDGDTWVIEALRDPPPADAPALRAAIDPGPPARLLLEGGQPGGVVILTDPATGETLLAGTLRRPGPAVVQPRRLPEFDLLPTMLGVAILARSDRLALRPGTENRFAITAANGESLGLGAPPGREPPAAATAMTRLLELPEGPVPVLLERLRNLLLAVQAAPPLARGPARRDAAETLLALGMPQEAQAMAALAFQEDPQSREDHRLLLAHGVAALLAGRVADARNIDDPRLPPRDEVVLWRALHALARGEAAAGALAAAAPLLLAYPEALRDRSLPLAAEALAEGRETTAAAALLAAAGEAPALGLARALLLEAEGRADDAIAAYDALAAGRDRRHRAVALRLAAGAIDAAAAADAVEQSVFAWRGGPEEVPQRRRAAALRIAAGQGSQAFALLDVTARLFPDQAEALRPDLQDAFAAALETAPPLVAATLFDAHPDLLPAGPRGESAVLLLADRLAGLDLADRAAALLRRAVAATEPGPARAAIGARLAALRAAEGDSAGVLAALDGSESAELDPALATRRTLLRARALARRGAAEEADALLARRGAPAAATRAELRAETQDWAGAAAAMADHLAATLPAAPAPLGAEDRAAIARTAAYLALAGDEPSLAALRAAHGARMEGGPLAEAFGVLTADPLRGVADLPRLQRELGLLRLMPARLDALRTGVQVAR